MTTDSKRLDQLERQQIMLEKYVIGGVFRALDRAYEHSLPHRLISCTVCGHTDTRDGFNLHHDECLFGGGHLERYGCKSCDAVFGPMKYLDLDEEFVDADYKLIYSRHAESDLTEVEVHAFHELKPKKSGRYLN